MNKMSHDLAEPVGRHDHQVKIGGVCIPLVSRSAVLPSSYSQQRLWFLHQLVPGGSNYNVPGVVKLEGPLDVEVLERELWEIVRRHQALRTRFVATGGNAADDPGRSGVEINFNVDDIVRDIVDLYLNTGSFSAIRRCLTVPHT